MKKFLSLLSKKSRLVIGVLSGTSVDAVDTVLVRITGNGSDTILNVIDFESFPIRKGLKKFILKCSVNQSSSVEDICRLNVVLGFLFAESVKKIVFRNKLSTKDIDLIGSHGQTIYHYPFNQKLLSYNSKSSLQIGDPSVIANQTGIITVGDFRTADISVNGDGAPLVPYLDYVLFNHNSKSRIFVNIGGISNITYLKQSCTQNDVIAFDTGPGNMLMDYLMKKFYDKKYDKSGITASKGQVSKELFKHISLKDKFYKKSPPKSTGREYYSGEFTENILKYFKKLKPEDIVATFTKYTAYTIFYNSRKFVNTDELIISGGGAKNHTLVKFIKEYFKDTEVNVMNENGINQDNKEAVLFAVLANEIVSGNKTNIPSVTGSDKNVFLGKICLS